MTTGARSTETLRGSRLAGLRAVDAEPPDPAPLDLAALAREVARHGDRDLSAFTSEELAATHPPSVDVPGLPDDPWLAGLDPDGRRVALTAATRSLAARGFLATAAGRGAAHGDLRLVHELRAAAPTVVQADVDGDVDGRRVRVRHLLCRAHPGLVLHLAATAGVHRASLRSEPSAGLCLAGVVVDARTAAGGTAPAELPRPLRGAELDRAREAIDASAARVLAAAHHRLGDGRVVTAHLALWRTPLGTILATGGAPDTRSRPAPQRDALRLVEPVVAVAVCVGLVTPPLGRERT